MVEYRGEAVASLSMEGRMTVSNMSIEWGAKAGMVAPDDTTFAYLEGRRYAPSDAAWEAALDYWRSLPTDDGAGFDTEVVLDAATVAPFVTWGTNPGQGVPLDGAVPDPDDFPTEAERAAAGRALEYMALRPGTALRDVPIDVVFVGSCTFEGRQGKGGRTHLVSPPVAAATAVAGRLAAPTDLK